MEIVKIVTTGANYYNYIASNLYCVFVSAYSLSLGLCSYWSFKTALSANSVPALREMNNFQFIFHNEQSVSFHWCFSMDSDSVQYVLRAEFNEAFSVQHFLLAMMPCTQSRLFLSNNFWMFCWVSRHFDKFPHHDVAGHIPAKLFTLDLKLTAWSGLQWVFWE